MANINRVNKGLWWLVTHILYKYKFAMIGRGAIIFKPMQLDKVKSIAIGEGVFVAEGAWLMGGDDGEHVTLEIGRESVIGHYSHIIATHDVVIENDVLVADKVFISDCTHNYSIITEHISKQGVSFLAPVRIGEGSWIGENVCICGASVGKHCVIGAGALVTKDIPDYCVAVGSPARIIKRYDVEKEEWIKA